MSIQNKPGRDLLYSTGNSTQYSALFYMGKESKSGYMYMKIHPKNHLVHRLHFTGWEVEGQRGKMKEIQFLLSGLACGDRVGSNAHSFYLDIY